MSRPTRGALTTPGAEVSDRQAAASIRAHDERDEREHEQQVAALVAVDARRAQRVPADVREERATRRRSPRRARARATRITRAARAADPASSTTIATTPHATSTAITPGTCQKLDLRDEVVGDAHAVVGDHAPDRADERERVAAEVLESARSAARCCSRSSRGRRATAAGSRARGSGRWPSAPTTSASTPPTAKRRRRSPPPIERRCRHAGSSSRRGGEEVRLLATARGRAWRARSRSAGLAARASTGRAISANASATTTSAKRGGDRVGRHGRRPGTARPA